MHAFVVPRVCVRVKLRLAYEARIHRHELVAMEKEKIRLSTVRFHI